MNGNFGISRKPFSPSNFPQGQSRHPGTLKGRTMADEWSGDLLARWRAGDQQAATEMFHRYANRLILLARSRLSPRLSHRVDPEDVVQSAYRSFFADTRD